MFSSMQSTDREFPDEKNVLLVHFSHIGNLKTKAGQILYVADERGVFAKMPAPRGVNLYLWGDLDGLNDGKSGNVVDLENGFPGLKVYRASKYGSSGGVLD